MGIVKKMILAATILVAASTTAVAADFDWIRDFNVQAQVDPSGFRAGLAARFKIGDAEIGAVLGNVAQPADAYMVLRLGEMSHQPPERVLDVYKKNKGKGWGVMAQSMGIKPGSAEFMALKKKHDFDPHFAAGKKGRKEKESRKERNNDGKGKEQGGSDREKARGRR